MCSTAPQGWLLGGFLHRDSKNLDGAVTEMDFKPFTSRKLSGRLPGSRPDGRGETRRITNRLRAWVFVALSLIRPLVLVAADDPEVDKLAKEVASRGWILFSAKTAAGDSDLFLVRPDGSGARNLSRTPGFDEYGGRWSPDGRRILYRRSNKGTVINHDLWGATGLLVIAQADGSDPQPQGADGDLPWASWSPDGRQVACLYKRQGLIRILDLQTKAVVKEFGRQGIFQQMFWSPDGQRLVGTANLQGRDWNVVSLELIGGRATQVSRDLCCTPDWFQHDARRIIYSCRTPGLGSDYGWTYLMQGRADGGERTLVFAERGRHIYYGGTSPDDQYVVFTNPVSDGGTDAGLAIVRMTDTPMVVPEDYGALKALCPQAKHGPVLRLERAGFEPQWTYAEIGGL